METIIKLIKDFMTKKGYGEIIIKFESGHIVNVKKTESVKVDN